MKKSYIRLILFEVILLIILLFNTFVFRFLTRNNFLLFLLISLLIFKIILGIEKDRHRYTKDIIIEILYFLLIFFIIYYLSGILIGFYKNQNYLTLINIKKIIIPITIRTVLIEYLRYATIVKSENNKGLLLLNFVLFFMINFTNVFYISSLSSAYKIFILFAVNIFPIITENIVASKMSLKLGFKPFLLYSLVMNLYVYILPIIPNYNEYLKSILFFILPLLLWQKVKNNLDSVNDKEISRDKKSKDFFPYILSSILIMIIIYFTSGYFKYYILAIGSGSMEPYIYKGDAVIINQKEDFNLLNVGQVIAFKKGNAIVVHRIAKIMKNSEDNYYYTKGDANENLDSDYVSVSDIVGVVSSRIPYIGIPTIWLNEL